jgi:hypothetical protein
MILVRPAHEYLPAGGEPHRTVRLPLGVIVSAVMVALVTGAGAAKLLHDARPGIAWLTALGLCGCLFALARRGARSEPTWVRVAAVLALTCLSFTYLLVLGGESARRLPGGGAAPFFTSLAMLLGIAMAAAVLPFVVLASALRWGRDSERQRPLMDMAPQLITGGLGGAAALLGFALVATAIWTSPPRWRLVTTAIVAIGSPALLIPFWTFMYKRLISRWRVMPPRALMDGLERLRSFTAFTFERVLCLDARFGSGRVCQVIAGPVRSTLVISESIAADLTSTQLLAVLSHEAAHLCLNHFRRKLAWGTVAGMLAVGTAVTVQVLIRPFLPRGLGVAAVLIVVLPVALLRGLYDTFVIRRHEAEADEFAVNVAGVPALLDALRVLRGPGGLEVLVHNRWTTHSTWERRIRRIQELESLRSDH